MHILRIFSLLCCHSQMSSTEIFIENTIFLCLRRQKNVSASELGIDNWILCA